jgi:amino acid permease
METQIQANGVHGAHHEDEKPLRLAAFEMEIPIGTRRNGNWWSAAFHNVTAVVSAGVLGLPNAMVFLTWGPGIVVLILSWIVTLFSFWQLIQLHERPPNKRFNRYHELGQEAFGKTRGFWIVVPLQLLVELSVDILYMVVGGQALQNIYNMNCSGDCPLSNLGPNPYRRTYIWILVFASVYFLLVQLPTLSSLSKLSLAAAIMSIGYSTIAWIIPVALNHQHNDMTNGNGLVSVTPRYHLPYYDGTTRGGKFHHTDTEAYVLSIFNALSTVAFAYAGHNVSLEIQATLPSTPEEPSRIAMWRGVMLAYAIIALCYFPVALICYWAYGNDLKKSNLGILRYESWPVWLATAANLMVVIHVTGSYLIYAMPLFDMMELVLVGKWRLPPSFKLRLITRSLYVGFTMVMAMTFPFFKGLLGFFGGFAYAPTTYFLPCCMWLAMCKPNRWSLEWTVNWICIILGVLLMLVGSIGGFWQIFVEAYAYKFYPN